MEQLETWSTIKSLDFSLKNCLLQRVYSANYWEIILKLIHILPKSGNFNVEAVIRQIACKYSIDILYCLSYSNIYND